MAYQLFIDGFNRESLAGGKWAAWSGCTINTTAGYARFGSGCLERAYGPGGDILRSRLFASSSHVVLGFAILLTGDAQNIEVRLANNWNRQIYLKISDWGLCELYDGGGILLWQASVDFYQGVWNFVELGVCCHATAGTVEVRINGDIDGSVLTDIQTQWVPDRVINSVYFGWDGPGDTGCLIDDLYITYGDEIKFLGDCRIDTYALNGDVPPQAWLPDSNVGAGNNHTLLNQEAGALVAAAAGAESLFNVANMTHTPNVLLGIQLNGVASKADAGNASIKLEVKNGETIAESALQYLSVSRTSFNYSLIYQPGTTDAWTISAINALQVGIKAVTL